MLEQLTPLILVASAVIMTAALIVGRRRRAPARPLAVAARVWLALWTLGLAGWSFARWLGVG